MKRTLDNCKLVTKYGHPRQTNGTCDGFQKSEYDDEPYSVCVDCPLHYINVEEREAQEQGEE
ncbi:hypothetical protein A5N82_13400 [Christensenella minuta]|nr:hypothetical protein [Christensenella minuta]AYH40729.1 hypothetical protein B1H56_09630 [Christensenella minuta]AYH41608.1 hypothetical protein B1H56_14365 [Christensenella minuta]OAQ37591.1 hypothetical protein A5N82_14005 [Christensenella minuta]OAQ38691.1 hypothetical protein A5N82_13400 [Christensenella minuta]